MVDNPCYHRNQANATQNQHAAQAAMPRLRGRQGGRQAATSHRGSSKRYNGNSSRIVGDWSHWSKYGGTAQLWSTVIVQQCLAAIRKAVARSVMFHMQYARRQWLAHLTLPWSHLAKRLLTNHCSTVVCMELSGCGIHVETAVNTWACLTKLQQS